MKDLDDNPPIMVHQNYAFEIAEGMPSHTVVGRVEATDADSLPENRVINYQLQTPTLTSDDTGTHNTGVATSAILHLFTIDRFV